MTHARLRREVRKRREAREVGERKARGGFGRRACHLPLLNYAKDLGSIAITCGESPRSLSCPVRVKT